MKIVGWVGKFKDPVPHHVELWYNHCARVWTVQLMNANDFQIGIAQYAHRKEDAKAIKAALECEHNLMNKQKPLT